MATGKSRYGQRLQGMKELGSLSLAWLAGLLEGEGSFQTYSRVTKHVKKDGTLGVYRSSYPRIQVQMTDKDVVEKVAALFNRACCGPYKREGAKDVYAAQVNGKDALALMQQLLPLMGKRRSLKMREVIDAYTKK